MLPYKSLIEKELEEKPETWEVIWFLLRKAPRLMGLIYTIIKLGANMDPNKTTNYTAIVSAGIGIICTLTAAFGYTIPADIQQYAIGAVCGIIGVIGYFTGKPKKA